MMGTFRGSDIQLKVDGKVIGTAQSIDAPKIEIEPDTLPKFPTTMTFEGNIQMEKGEFALGAMADLFRGYKPTFDIEIEGWKRVRPLPKGRTRLPKRSRIRKKWLKRYYAMTKTRYNGCTLVGESVDSMTLEYRKPSN